MGATTVTASDDDNTILLGNTNLGGWDIADTDSTFDSISLHSNSVYGEYIQYIIAAVLLLVFYKKFIVNHEVIVMNDKPVAKKVATGGDDDMDFLNDFEHEFDTGSAHGRLKAKIKSQIMNNIEGLDEEGAAKYEVLIEELDREINNSPHEIAGMLELLLSEGDTKFRGK